jgi:hypothetical protein
MRRLMRVGRLAGEGAHACPRCGPADPRHSCRSLPLLATRCVRARWFPRATPFPISREYLPSTWRLPSSKRSTGPRMARGATGEPLAPSARSATES